MAHLRSLTAYCARCDDRATVVLINQHGVRLGLYCAEHGHEALRVAEADEARAHRRASPPQTAPVEPGAARSEVDEPQENDHS